MLFRSNEEELNFIEYHNYYKNENIDRLLKINAKINIPLSKSKMCVILNINKLEKYDILFEYIKLLNLNECYIDIYLGIDSNISIETLFGLNKLNQLDNFNFVDNINLIKTKYNYNVNKSNFYIGYNLQKKYDKSIIIDTNLIKFLNINLIDKIYIINNNFELDILDKHDKFNYICEFLYQKYLLKIGRAHV